MRIVVLAGALLACSGGQQGMVADDDSGSGGECPAASRSAVVGRAGGTRTAQRGRSARRWAQVLSAI